MLPLEFNSLVGFNPGESIRRLQRELIRVLEGDFPGDDVDYPYLNVTQKGDDLNVTTMLPAVSAADLDISVEGNTLTLRGERKPEPLAEGEKYVRRERPFGRFVRSIELPFAIDAEKVEASYEKGVLRIKLPRAEKDKPRKISIS